MLYDSTNVTPKLEIAMRPTLLLVCALTILLAACGSRSRPDNARSPSSGAYARPALGAVRVRGDYAN